MFLETALILLQSTTLSSADLTCYAAKRGQYDQVIAVSKKSNRSLTAKDLRTVPCPENFVWTSEIAERKCRALATYDDFQTTEYIEYYGASPKEICEIGKEAAGIKSALSE